MTVVFTKDYHEFRSIMSKKRLWLFLVIVLFVATDLLVSLWFFVPSFKNRLLAEYYTRRYPVIPRSEFIGFDKKNFRTDENGYALFYKNNKLFKTKGVTTIVIQQDGSEEYRYLGKVTLLPKELWEDEIGSTEASALLSIGQSVDLKHQKIAIRQDDDWKIVTVPINRKVEVYKEVIDINGSRIRKVNQTLPAILGDIEVDDIVEIIESKDSVRVTITKTKS